MINVFTKLNQQDKWEAALGGGERGGRGWCRTETCGRDGWRWGRGSGGWGRPVGGGAEEKRLGDICAQQTNIVRSSLPCGRNLHELVILPPPPPTPPPVFPSPHTWLISWVADDHLVSALKDGKTNSGACQVEDVFAVAGRMSGEWREGGGRGKGEERFEPHSSGGDK